MFQERAPELLREIQQHVTPSDYAIINLLIEAPTFLEMFELGHYYLFGHDELQDSFPPDGIYSSRDTTTLKRL